MLRSIIDNPPQLKHRKPTPRYAHVSLNLCAVCVSGDQKWSVDQMPAEFQTTIMNTLATSQLVVRINNTVLYTGNIPQHSMAINGKVDDAHTMTHQLEFIIDGLDQQHGGWNVDGFGRVNIMLNCASFELEGLDMCRTLADKGTYTVDHVVHIPGGLYGQNGVVAFDFCTPIYPWLLANDPESYNNRYTSW